MVVTLIEPLRGKSHDGSGTKRKGVWRSLVSKVLGGWPKFYDKQSPINTHTLCLSYKHTHTYSTHSYTHSHFLLLVKNKNWSEVWISFLSLAGPMGSRTLRSAFPDYCFCLSLLAHERYDLTAHRRGHRNRWWRRRWWLNGFTPPWNPLVGFWCWGQSQHALQFLPQYQTTHGLLWSWICK